MSQIKFRTWSKVGQQIIDWDTLKGSFTKLLDDPNYPMMRFTGLFDKNGKEIYEGDIVKWDDRSGGERWRFAVVKINPDICFDCAPVGTIDGIFNSGGLYRFRFGSFLYQETEDYLTVIGNMYENSEWMA